MRTKISRIVPAFTKGYDFPPITYSTLVIVAMRY
jgi:hypothetical protein